jgi:precorrin-2 dehydrogenase/sirohydrochlorin ferrochelatase
LRYYPAFLDLHGKKVVVIGGGAIGERKAASLLASGASVTVVAPTVSSQLEAWTREGRINHLPRSYEPRDTEGAWMVVAATDDPEANRRIASQIPGGDCLVNVVDLPELSNFIVPSIVVRGDLVLAVSTGGAAPAFARKLRMDLEKQFGGEYVPYLTLLKRVRQALGDRNGEERKAILYRLIESDLLELVRERRLEEIRNRIRDLAGLENPDLTFL